MRTLLISSLIAAVLLGGTVDAMTPAVRPAAPMQRIANEVRPVRLRATISRLVGFGTRHTLSDTRSATRGIGAARNWVRREFEAMSDRCAAPLRIETPSQVFTGDRIPQPTEVMDILAIQPGTEEPDRVVVISAHLDSRVSDVMDAVSDAPGANDDASGVAAVLEAARVLCGRRFRATIVYAVLSGEEQGLYGGRVLADYATSQHWRVEADLNNDIIGNTLGQDGVGDSTHVRVFSEGTRSRETQQEAARRRYNGGEVDSPSRNLARYMDALADAWLPGFDVVMVYRTDRYGRGGDQVRMLEAGYPSIRVTEARENYDRQHQTLRTENGVAYGDVISGVDFEYLAQVTRLNAITLASLADAPAPPSGVEISGAVSSDTTVRWSPSPGATGYRIWWRGTTEPQWRHSLTVGTVASVVLRGVVIDDYFFGVQALGVDGAESPIVFPGVAGAFFPPPP